MKTLDVKSLLIGALLTSTIFLGVAAIPAGTSASSIKDGHWDNDQVWRVDYKPLGLKDGFPLTMNPMKAYEPFATVTKGGKTYIVSRQRIK